MRILNLAISQHFGRKPKIAVRAITLSSLGFSPMHALKAVASYGVVHVQREPLETRLNQERRI
jgi:hypothetical protein